MTARPDMTIMWGFHNLQRLISKPAATARTLIINMPFTLQSKKRKEKYSICKELCQNMVISYKCLPIKAEIFIQMSELVFRVCLFVFLRISHIQTANSSKWPGKCYAEGIHSHKTLERVSSHQIGPLGQREGAQPTVWSPLCMSCATT